MKKTNKSKYAILGLLSEGPHSGYELKQFMLEYTTHFWQESDASIYPMLKTLRVKNKVTAKSEFVGKRERTMFEITDLGKKDLVQWLALPAEQGTQRNEFLLKLFFSIDKEAVIKQLLLEQKRVAELGRKFENIAKNISANIPDDNLRKFFWIMTLNNGVAHVKAQEHWLADCLKMLKK